MLRALLRVLSIGAFVEDTTADAPLGEASAVDNSKMSLKEIVQVRVQPLEDF